MLLRSLVLKLLLRSLVLKLLKARLFDVASFETSRGVSCGKVDYEWAFLAPEVCGSFTAAFT